MSIQEFIPYGKQLIDQDDIDHVISVLRSPYLTMGPRVRELENAIKEYCGAKYCVVVSSGTAALHLSSLALLSRGDKVLTTPNSFLATSNSILYAGAVPKFIDISEDGNIDLDLCEDEIKRNKSIKAIYAVAFSGNMLSQKKLKHLKETYNILILEDCCHAIGATEKAIKAGSCTNSDVSIFSFHPIKHITTGEGGAITTNSEKIYRKIIALRSHGVYKDETMKPWEYEMRDLGFNYRITDIQCALGLSQLKKLDHFIERRREIAQHYDEFFKNSILKPLYLENTGSSYHIYVVKLDFTNLNINKEQFFKKLRENGVGVQLHYMPINKQPYYRSLGYGSECTPVMDEYYKECFSLPVFPGLSDKEQRYVVSLIFEVLVKRYG